MTFFATTEGAVDAAAPQKFSIDAGKLVIELTPGYLAEEEKLSVLEGVLVTRSGIDGGIQRKGVKLAATFNRGS